MVEHEKAKRKSRRERFVTVAALRTRRVLRDLRLLAKCGNRAIYDYSDADVEKIVSAVERETELMKARFRRPEVGKEVQFSLE